MIVSAEYFAITGLINFITTFTLGIFILRKSSAIKANRYFAYFCLAASLWAFFYAVVFIVPSVRMKEYYLAVSMIGSFFCPITFLHFTKHFLKKNISSWFIALNYLFAVIAMPFAFTGYYADGMSLYFGMWWGNRGPCFDVTFIQFVLVLVYAFICYIDSLRKEKDPQFRRQIRLVFIALLIGFISGATNFFFWYRIPIPPVTNVFVSVYVIMVTYSIMKYKLMDIQITIKNSLVYSLLIAMISVVYFAIIYLSEQYLKGIIGYQSMVVSLVTAFVVAIFYIPFKDFIQSLVEKNIFKATYAQISEQNENLRRQVQLSERYRAFSEITQSVSAAIRNPLTVIKTYNYYLAQRINDPGFLDKYMKVTSVEIERMEQMINELSKYSSPDPLMLEKVDMSALLDEVLESLSHTLYTRRIQVDKQYHPHDSLRIHADAKQLHQAFVNIFRHEFKMMPDEGRFEIETLPGQDTLTVRIKDNGRVIPEDQLEKIFDPFIRFDEADQGLELAIAFSIIESHAGKVSVVSREGQGNEFIIQLPTKPHA